jgi:hypothetical protein
MPRKLFIERFAAMKRVSVFLPLVVLLCISGCDLWSGGSSVPEKVVLGDTTGTLSITGTVQYLQLEGGFWAIEGRATDTASTETYEPINLPESFEQNGLSVSVRAKQRNDLGSYRMVGPVIEIRSIEPRN